MLNRVNVSTIDARRSELVAELILEVRFRGGRRTVNRRGRAGARRGRGARAGLSGVARRLVSTLEV
jgi:hypothetical protein